MTALIPRDRLHSRGDGEVSDHRFYRLATIQRNDAPDPTVQILASAPTPSHSSRRQEYGRPFFEFRSGFCPQIPILPPDTACRLCGTPKFSPRC